MGLPLISPVDVTVSPIDQASTHHNGRAREPVKAVGRGSSITLKAQISWDKRQEMTADRAGNAPATSGYIVTRRWMLEAAGWTPTTGDKITRVAARQNQQLYVISFEDCGHLDGENDLVLIRFSSRQPAR